MKILLLNAGSSSLKVSLVDAADGRLLAHGLADWAGSTTHYSYAGGDGEGPVETVSFATHTEAVRRFVFDLTHREPVQLPRALERNSDLAAVGHRIVHGGPFETSVRVTPEIRSQLAALADLAPLHNPSGLAAIAAAEAELPGVPQIAVFDTAFHATLPPEAYTYPIPSSWTRDWGIRRFGFHGLSYAYCSRRAADLLSRPPESLRLVICHLGHGCSAAAIRGGQSIDTTMGFTPLDGLMMATRSGSIDPSIPLYVQQHHGLTAEQVESALNRSSGLLGVSNVSADMREVLAAADAGSAPAQLALAIYTRRVRQAIGSFAVTLGGIDALVFTAGVGEHAPRIRKGISAGLESLGLQLDDHLNETCGCDADIASTTSPGRILIIAAREDVAMLREVMHALGHSPAKV